MRLGSRIAAFVVLCACAVAALPDTERYYIRNLQVTTKVASSGTWKLSCSFEWSVPDTKAKILVYRSYESTAKPNAEWELLQLDPKAFTRTDSGVRFETSAEKSKGQLLVMVEGQFGDVSNTRKQFAFIADEYPTKQGDERPGLPGGVIPITMEPRLVASINPMSPWLAADQDWVEFGQYRDENMTATDPYYNKVRLYKKESMDPSPREGWETITDNQRGSGQVLYYDVPEFEDRGLVGIWHMHHTPTSSGDSKIETSGIIRPYPLIETARMPIHEADYAGELTLATGNPGFKKVIAVHRDGSKLLEGVIYPRLAKRFFSPSQDHRVVPFSDLKDLGAALASVQVRGERFATIEIVAHGNGFMCGPLHSCNVRSFGKVLEPFVTTRSKLFLDGCLTGTCPEPAPIAQAVANLGLCKVYGARGFMSPFALAEHGMSDALKASRRSVTRGDITYFYELCTIDAQGPQSFKEFIRGGPVSYSGCRPPAVTGLDNTGMEKATAVAIRAALLKSLYGTPDKPLPPSAPEAPLLLAPDLSFQAYGRTYDLMADFTILRDRDAGVVRRFEADSALRKALRVLVSPSVHQ